MFKFITKHHVNFLGHFGNDVGDNGRVHAKGGAYSAKGRVSAF